jgi:putative transposase
MAERHLWIGLRYVEANPVRAEIVAAPEEYRWSSARVHLLGVDDRSQLLDLTFWQRSGGTETWREMHASVDRSAQTHLLRRCTYAGRPFGDESFVAGLEQHFQRKWRRWSFEKAIDNRMLA